jgi:hypothetical protein
MILGMSEATYTFSHVLISLIGIGSGLIVMFGFLTGKRFDGLTVVFLLTTVLTSVTGFGFPFDHLLPSHKDGILSLLVLAVAIPARYVFHLAGSWRWIYVIGASIALYLNVFVLIVQALPQGTGPQSTSSDAVRASIFGRAALRSFAFRRADDFSGEEVSRRVGANRLTDAFGFAEFGPEGRRRQPICYDSTPSNGRVIADATRPFASSAGGPV